LRKNAKIKDVWDIKLGRKNTGFTGSMQDWDDEVEGYKVDPKLAEEIRAHEARVVESVPSSESQEQIAEAREINTDSVKDYKLPDQKILEDEAPRRGQRMNHLQFIEKLRAAGVRCWYNTEPFRGLIGLRAIAPGYEQLGLRFICGVKLGWTTEYDTFHFDERGLPLNKKTVGWRSVILQLIAKKILTEEKAHRIFGKPRENTASSLYRKTLWEMRNQRARGETETITGAIQNG
jgi:hypothetical protein